MQQIIIPLPEGFYEDFMDVLNDCVYVDPNNKNATNILGFNYYLCGWFKVVIGTQKNIQINAIFDIENQTVFMKKSHEYLAIYIPEILKCLNFNYGGKADIINLGENGICLLFQE